jgi:predicted phage tail protein
MSNDMAEEIILRDIYLHGNIGRKYGSHFRLKVHSPAEAFRALFANFPAMRQDIRDGSWVIYRGEPETGLLLGEENLGLGLGKAPLHILPAPVGSNGGSAKLILGAVLVVASIATGQVEGIGMSAALFAGSSITLGSLAGIGAALALSGIAQLIAPNQKLNAEATAGSTLFNGAVNTATEGTPVPIVYGKILMGSVVGSVYLGTEKLTTPYIPPSTAPEVFPGVQVIIQT